MEESKEKEQAPAEKSPIVNPNGKKSPDSPKKGDKKGEKKGGKASKSPDGKKSPEPKEETSPKLEKNDKLKKERSP